VPPISANHGRVDSDNNVFVLDGGTERKVGQYPGVTEAEALTYFERKFSELEANVRILEQRLKTGANPASIAAAAQKLVKDLVEPAAVGNIQELRNRVAAITPNIEKVRAEKSEATVAAIAATLKTRTEIAQKAAALADKDPKKTQWKVASKEMTELFEAWQASQKSGPKVPRKEADLIWKSFSQARTKFEANKRAFFAELTAVTKTARAKKSDLAAKAEALVAKGSDAALASTENCLMNGSSRVDHRASRTMLSGIVSKRLATQSTRSAKRPLLKRPWLSRLTTRSKLALIVEAEKLDPTKDLAEAKKQLAINPTALREGWKSSKRQDSRNRRSNARCREEIQGT
jgi:hypothetical protein